MFVRFLVVLDSLLLRGLVDYEFKLVLVYNRDKCIFSVKLGFD